MGRPPNCRFRSIKPDDTSAKAASASQDMSINDVSQTVNGNATAADNDNTITDATAPSAATPAAAADAAAAAAEGAAPRPTPPRFLLLDLRRRQPRQPRQWPRPRPQAPTAEAQVSRRVP
jgi:hypothetical protein